MILRKIRRNERWMIYEDVNTGNSVYDVYGNHNDNDLFRKWYYKGQSHDKKSFKGRLIGRISIFGNHAYYHCGIDIRWVYYKERKVGLYNKLINFLYSHTDE